MSQEGVIRAAAPKTMACPRPSTEALIPQAAWAGHVRLLSVSAKVIGITYVDTYLGPQIHFSDANPAEKLGWRSKGRSQFENEGFGLQSASNDALPPAGPAVNLDSLISDVETALAEYLGNSEEERRSPLRPMLSERLAVLNDYLNNRATDREREHVANRVKYILDTLAYLSWREFSEILVPSRSTMDQNMNRLMATAEWNNAQLKRRATRLDDEKHDRILFLYRFIGEIASGQLAMDLLLENCPQKWVRQRYSLDIQRGIKEQDLVKLVALVSPMSPVFINILQVVTRQYIRDGIISGQEILNKFSLEPADKLRLYIRQIATITGIRHDQDVEHCPERRNSFFEFSRDVDAHTERPEESASSASADPLLQRFREIQAALNAGKKVTVDGAEKLPKGHVTDTNDKDAENLRIRVKFDGPHTPAPVWMVLRFAQDRVWIHGERPEESETVSPSQQRKPKGKKLKASELDPSWRTRKRGIGSYAPRQKKDKRIVATENAIIEFADTFPGDHVSIRELARAIHKTESALWHRDVRAIVASRDAVRKEKGLPFPLHLNDRSDYQKRLKAAA